VSQSALLSTPPKTVFLGDIAKYEGQTVTDFFAVAQKQFSRKRDGAAYLTLRLTDRTGQCEAKMWDNFEACADTFQAGDVVKVQARTAAMLHQIETEDTALALLEFSSGALGQLQATTAAYPGYPRRVEITGSEGTIILEQDRIVAINLRTPYQGPISSEVADQNPSTSSPLVSDIRGHQSAIEDFILAIEKGTAPMCDGREGRKSLALVEAIYKASGQR